MDLLLFAFLFFINFIFLILTYYSEGENYFFPIVSGTMFLILAALLINEGIVITYTGSYGFVAANSTSMVGVAVTTVIRKDIYTGAFGSIFLVCAFYMFLVPLIERASREVKEGGTVE